MNKTFFRMLDMMAGLKDIDWMLEGKKTVFLSIPGDWPVKKMIWAYQSVCEWAGSEWTVFAPFMATFVTDETGNRKYSDHEITKMADKVLHYCDEVWVLMGHLAPNMVTDIYYAAKAGRKVMGVTELKEETKDE